MRSVLAQQPAQWDSACSILQMSNKSKQNRTCHLEGSYKYRLVQLPDHFRADQKLKPVIKGIVQMPLEQ